jgi:molybdate transport system substrate-binding protein
MRSLALGLVAAALSVSGCRRSRDEASTREATLVIFAAASLRDVFTVIANEFEKLHPGVTVSFNFAGTQELRTQIEHGATPDVFASADQQHMIDLTRQGLVRDPVVFARNEPVLIVSRQSAHSIRSLSDLPSADRIVIGTPEVPIGRYTLQILDRAGASLGADFRARVEAKIVSRELNVRQVLTRVRLGEAQAGIVYRTDAISAAADIEIVTIPPDINVIAEYPAALVSAAVHTTLARAWVDLLVSAQGQRTLQLSGFLPVATRPDAP